jgi:uncharacterized membrane protein
MENINNVKKLTRASMMLVFALVVIFTGSRLGGVTFNSFVVGPLVNAVIIATVLISDTKFGMLVGLCTPVLAALTGQLASPMVPFVPFIMAGNITFALIFGLLSKYIKKYGNYVGIGVGAVLKTLVLAVSAKYLVVLLSISIPKPVMAKLITVMSYPQLYSAVAGGIVALIFYSVFKKAYKN